MSTGHHPDNVRTRDRRTAGAGGRRIPPGPYVAKVVSHLDSKRMGTLQVQILSDVIGGSDPEQAEGQLYSAEYCMPFYGVNDVASNRRDDRYSATQQSYGFWAVPPDPGTRVLVIFAEGQTNQCYWIGCIQDTYMNFMVPGGYPASKSTKVVQDLLIDDFKDKPLPTGEYNKSIHGTVGNNPDAFLRPHNPFMVQALATQGLLEDPIRGLTSTSARRDIPSTVFGWNTPGPLDKNDGAPKGRYGTANNKIEYFRSRLGGSAFTMDDGDPTILREGPAVDTPSTYYDISSTPSNVSRAKPDLLFNEHIRLRTRTGHQILLHNSEDLIYIGNARGSAWVELTAQGKIDIYADDSISISTGNDINLFSNRDINISASRDLNLNAGRDYKMSAANNMDVKIGVSAKFDVGADYDQYVGANQKVFVGAEGHLVVAGAHKITSQSTLDVLTASTAKHKQSSLHMVSEGNSNFTAGFNTSILSGSEHRESAPAIHMNTAANPATQADEAASAANATTAAAAPHPQRVPEREPWASHENLNPPEHTPNRTQAIPAPPSRRYQPTPLISTYADGQEYTRLSGPVVANTPAAGGNPQVVVPGSTIPEGNLPGSPVPILDLQRYFLHVLTQEIPLDPAKIHISANPANLAAGQEPGHAEAVAMALAQVQIECGFVPESENMNYRADRLRAVFPSRVTSDAFARELVAAGPAAIGNTLYGGRNGNARDEGYKYRGRGLIQITFKDNYRHFGNAAGHPEIVENPEMANDPVVATAIAVAYLKETFPQRGGGNWSMYNFNQLGEAFEDAVGYGDPDNSTPRRIQAGRGFYSRLINRELTPLASLTPTEPQGTGETTIVTSNSNIPDDGLRG